MFNPFTLIAEAGPRVAAFDWLPAKVMGGVVGAISMLVLGITSTKALWKYTREGFSSLKQGYRSLMHFRAKLVALINYLDKEVRPNGGGSLRDIVVNMRETVDTTAAQVKEMGPRLATVEQNVEKNHKQAAEIKETAAQTSERVAKLRVGQQYTHNTMAHVSRVQEIHTRIIRRVAKHDELGDLHASNIAQELREADRAELEGIPAEQLPSPVRDILEASHSLPVPPDEEYTEE